MGLKRICAYLSTFKKYRPLLKELVKRDITVRYRHSFLGMLWTILNPLLMMIVLSVVFSSLFKNSIENYPVYVMIGNVVFNCGSEATNRGLSSIIWNSSLIKKVYIPKYLFPLATVASSLINFGFSFVALLLVMLFTGAPFHLTLITAWIPLLYLIVFSLGLSLALCAINVYFRDIEHLYGVFVTVWMYLSAIFYSIDILPHPISSVVYYNPMYQFITFFRKIVMEGVFPNIGTNLLCGFYAIVSLILGLCVFYKLQDRFILHI